MVGQSKWTGTFLPGDYMCRKGEMGKRDSICGMRSTIWE